MNGALKGLIAFILIVGLLAGGVYIYYATEKNATFRKDEVVDVEIKQGSSASTIASVLEENGVIGSKYVFRFYIRGKDIVFQYGTFHLNRKMNYDELIEQLTTQQVVRETTDITIKEGMNAEQIIAMLEELGIGTRDEILYAINEAEYDFDFITPDMTWVDYRLEGYLYPDTYEIYLDDSPEEVIVRLLDNFDKKTANRREEVAINGGNFHETMILASIIEKEGQKESELPIVSSVFHNRLDQGMKLESCATVQYVLYYFITVSVIGAIVCIYDKLAAARGWRRVPERTLFFWALIGGGPGVYATMLIIRHKTLHHIFMLGIPAIMILQGAIIVGIYNILYMKGLL